MKPIVDFKKWRPTFAQKCMKTSFCRSYWKRSSWSLWEKICRQNKSHKNFPESLGKFGQKSFASPKICLLLKLWLKEYCQKNKRQRWYICEEFSVWHFVTKNTCLKSVKPGMSSHFCELRDPSYANSAMYPESPRKEWRTKSFGLQSTPTGKRTGVCPRSRLRDDISDLAWSRPGVEASRTIWNFCWWWCISGPLRTAAPATLPKEKTGTKMSEWMSMVGLHWTFPFTNLSLVCLPKVNVVFK